MAWNLTVCTSPNVMKMSNKNLGEQVLGIASPQVALCFRDSESLANGSPKRPFYSAFDQQDEVMDEDPVDDSLQQTEKKRRLTSDQVQFLEMSFEVENKLEPERKSLIAKQLGLQPRQVAVWFQNRRARWKTKQLEKDYEILKTEYTDVLMENEKLKAEVARLKAQLQSPTGRNGVDIEKELEDPEVEGEAAQLGEFQNETQQSLGKAEEVSSVCGKSDLGSPTKSDLSEVLDSGSCSLAMDRGCELKIESSSLPPVLKVEDSTVIASTEEQQAFVNICNPLLIQQVAVKLETGIFPDDSYGFIFSWDDHNMFPW